MPDLDSEQALANLAGRVRSRHCEPGSDSDAYNLAVWVTDLIGVIGGVRAWADHTRTAPEDDEAGHDIARDLFADWERYLHRRGRRHG